MKISSMIITGLFVGAAGAIAASIFASDKASKTRNKMTRKGKLYKDYGRISSVFRGEKGGFQD